MNKTEVDELDDFQINITASMDAAKHQFTTWMKNEQNRHETYMKKLTEDIEEKSQALVVKLMKQEIATEEKEFKTQSRMSQFLNENRLKNQRFMPDHAITEEKKTEHQLHYESIFGTTTTTEHTSTSSPGNTSGAHDYNDKYIKFVDRSVEEFTMQDHDLKKGPPLAKPLSNKDIMILYGQVQKQAISYNIFVMPINHIDKWNHDDTAIPHTCYLTQTHNINKPTYDRMTHAFLYDKLIRVISLKRLKL